MEGGRTARKTMTGDETVRNAFSFRNVSLSWCPLSPKNSELDQIVGGDNYLDQRVASFPDVTHCPHNSRELGP